jgi:cytochrome c peroxidase
MPGLGRLGTLICGLCLAAAVLLLARAQEPPRTPRLEITFDETGLTPLERLGLRMFFDAALSEPAGVSCASCHEPARAFTGNNGSGLGVARGSLPGALGFRDAPSLMYLAHAPAFGFVEKDGKRVPVGGLFWDGRANTLEEQATQPLLNPLEMNNADARALAAKLARAPYAGELRQLFGERVFDDPDAVLDAVGKAFGAFQRTRIFQPYSSKFDAVMRREAQFTEQEQRGLGLFKIRQKGNCAACHTVDEDSRDPRASPFTDFGYHAVAVPRNARIPHNAKPSYRDQGLCGPHRSDPIAADSRWCGFFKAPTLRNITLTAPYMHNGAFESLRDAVAFYATRDTNPERWYPGGRKFDDLAPDHHANVDIDTPPYNRQPGRRPQLTDEDIDDIVAFLHTLTDGYGVSKQSARMP